MNKLSILANKLKYVLRLNIFNPLFPTKEDVAVEIYTKKKDVSFTKKDAINCLDGFYRDKIDRESLDGILNELVQDGILIRTKNIFEFNKEME